MRHIDEEFAARSMFGGLTASGAHTFARGQLTAGIAREIKKGARGAAEVLDTATLWVRGRKIQLEGILADEDRRVVRPLERRSVTVAASKGRICLR